MGRQFIWVTIPPNIRAFAIRMVRIVPKFNGNYFEIEFVYDPEIQVPKLDYNHYLSVDLGLNNYATVVSTKETAFIIEGKGIKSYNQWWNKEKAQLQSIYDKQGIKQGSKMTNLNIDRYNTIRNFISHAVNHLITHCLANEIGNLIIGDWGDLKRSLKMLKKTAQSFQQIPFGPFKLKIQSKCDIYGIKLHLVNESYTSKTCSSCGIVRGANRVKRGLYRCNNCALELNADINGALNILQKVVSKNLFDQFQWDSGDIISPKRVKLVYFTT